MENILIIYSSVDGQTFKICKHIVNILEQNEKLVTLLSIDQSNDIDLSIFDKIIIGSSVRYGKHSKKIKKFITKHTARISSKPNAFFSVNLIARNPEKALPHSNTYLNRFLSDISWQPKNLAVFAGKVDYPNYKFFDRVMIQLIMLMTQGPTNPKSTIEYTNWEKVEEFGNLICQIK